MLTITDMWDEFSSRSLGNWMPDDLLKAKRIFLAGAIGLLRAALSDEDRAWPEALQDLTREIETLNRKEVPDANDNDPIDGK